MNNESVKPNGGKALYEAPETSAFSLSVERNFLQVSSGGQEQPGGEPGEN
jgi:hypothetical protein